ncbi:MAG: heavy-metal-associated domain-containing protein [Prolixibacteraceae bacterium]|jgi:copper chaperone|nr:heavy-metal-associated domain-containing protein [Prolixibacteraceae bacterium]
METFQFKTNVKCGGCVATVTPYLNQVKGIIRWSVDTAGPQKILTTETSGISPEEIIETMKNAGYTASLIDTRPSR